MTAGDDGENWMVIGPFHAELRLQVPNMVDNRSLTLDSRHSTMGDEFTMSGGTTSWLNRKKQRLHY